MSTPVPPMERIRRRMAGVDTSDPDACHEWPGARQPGGYGHIQVGPRFVRVPRIVLEHRLGRAIHPGMCALHTCDNPPCCNDRHLYEGTRSQNQQDTITRGRRVVGERHPRARLTAGQVASIVADVRPQRIVASEYGVAQSLVSMIRRGQRRRFG